MRTGILPEGKDLADMTREELLAFLDTKSRTGVINVLLAILGHESIPSESNHASTKEQG